MIMWNVLRAAGIGAYLMLWASVVWGLVATTSIFGKRVAKPTSILIHQFFATVGLLLLGVHLGGLLIDSFMDFGPLDVLVPFASSFRPIATAFGVLSMYAMVIALGSSWARKKVGASWWRLLHLLAVPSFILALAHGIFAGTDTQRPWMWVTYVVTGATALFLLVVRGLADARPKRAEVPAGARVRTPAPSAAPAPAPAPTPASAPAPAPVPPNSNHEGERISV